MIPHELLPPTRSLLHLHCLPIMSPYYESINGSIIPLMRSDISGCKSSLWRPSPDQLEVFINPIRLAVKIAITILENSPPQHQCQRKQGHLCPDTLEAPALNDGSIIMQLALPLTRLTRCVFQTLIAPLSVLREGQCQCELRSCNVLGADVEKER